MKRKWYTITLVGLIILLVGSWGYMAWHLTQDGQAKNAAVANDLQTDPVVKKSSSGICHDKTSAYYSATKKFKAFDNVQQCLDSGGRLPY